MTCAMGGPRRRCSESHKVIWGLSPCVCARLESRVSFVEKRKTDMSGAGRRDKGTVLEYTKVYIYIFRHTRETFLFCRRNFRMDFRKKDEYKSCSGRRGPAEFIVLISIRLL